MSSTTATSPRASAYDLRLGLAERWFPFGVAACAVALAAFLLARLKTWPPHEDETLALFVGRDSLGGLWTTVTGDRGGAPLHFLVAWLVEHLGGGLTALRLASALFAVASVPVLAALSARLAGRRVALVATVLVSASWLMLFHGIYGRMYSLFLLLSALSYLALLRAADRGTARRWTLWALAALATVATHPYGALVLASEAAFVLARARDRAALWALGGVVLAATPFWYADLVLAGRFDVGIGGGGEKLGGPTSLLHYLWQVAGDASTGFGFALVPALLLAAYGWWKLRARPDAALLTAIVVVLPALALLLARLGDSTSPETRHLVFVLPFFGTALAMGVVSLLRRPLPIACALVVLVAAEVGWAWHRTPQLFEGEAGSRIEARHAASALLAATARNNDILLGYDPVFLEAWERDRGFPRTVVPRADAKLAVNALSSARKPLGRGVWILDAGDSANDPPRASIPYRLPQPESAFEAQRFGPYLVIRTREPTGTLLRYLTLAESAMRLGAELGIVDAAVNLKTIQRSEERARSRSTVSR